MFVVHSILNIIAFILLYLKELVFSGVIRQVYGFRQLLLQDLLRDQFLGGLHQALGFLGLLLILSRLGLVGLRSHSRSRD